MPIDNPHPSYAENIGKWSRCRDAYEGEDAVKDAGEKYLPKLGGQDTKEYEAYVTRALYYGAVGRTIDGFVGAIARKPATLTLPAKLEALKNDITADGIGIGEFIKKMCSETLLMGRGGILVDFEEPRAYLALYTTEQIVNWFEGNIVLLESVCIADGTDPFKQTSIQQYRQLHIDDGKYTVTIWRKKSGATAGSEWAVYETTVPTNRGKPMKEIPFFWISKLGSTANIEKPPMLDLVNIALSHYRTSADLEHGRHFTGLPTLWITGDKGQTPIRIGATTAIILPDPNAKVGYAEFTGQGLGSLENALESKEQMMAVLGAAVFVAQKKGVEAAETARIRTSGETSLLMGVVTAVEEVLAAALKCAAGWMGTTSEPKVSINRDFVDVKLDAPSLVALTKAYLSGAITLETFLFNMQQAEMLSPDTSIEDEAKLLTEKAEKAAKDAAKAAKVKPKSKPTTKTKENPDVT